MYIYQKNNSVHMWRRLSSYIGMIHTLSNYKHNAYSTLMVLKWGRWEPITCKNFVLVFIKNQIEPLTAHHHYK